MTDNINNFLEEASIEELLKEYHEAEHKDEKEFIANEIENRMREDHDCDENCDCQLILAEINRI